MTDMNANTISSTPNTNGSADIASSSSSRSLLEQIIPKLRPFQREGLEFATEGKQYERQFANTTATGGDGSNDNANSNNSQRNNTNTKKRQRVQQNESNSTKASKQQQKQLNIDTTDLLGKGRILLADEMGLGKTVTSLAIMSYYENEWPLLIICPASLRYTWPNEIEKFLPSIPSQSIYVVTGFNDIAFVKRLAFVMKRSSADTIKIVIITYSLIQERSAVSHALLNECNFQCIIVDESHNIKQPKSQRTKLIMPLLSNAKRLLLLSGTPALAKPVELWTQLFCLAPKLFGSFNEYTARYCNPQRKPFYGYNNRNGGGGYNKASYIMDYNGSSNEGELHAKLKNVMVRRLKCHVLTELPSKQRSIIPVNITEKEQRQKCMQIIQELNDKRVSVSDLFRSNNNEASRKADFEAKAKLMKAYQQSGIGKAQSAADYVTDCWFPGSLPTQKILIFCHHIEVMNIIEQSLIRKYPNSLIRIDGSVQPIIRQQLVRKFQTCARIRVGLLSMTAAGVGITLTAASTVLFAELHWTPGVLAQAEDRAHRIGCLHSSINIVYMVCKDPTVSVDGILWNMLGKKINTLDNVIDGGKDDKPYIYEAEEESAEKGGVSKNTGTGIQTELVQFFAETIDETQKKQKTPMKGSIEQYFMKQSQSPNCLKTATTNCQSNAIKQSNTIALPGASESHDKPQHKKATGLMMLTTTSVRKDDNLVWSCKICTYRNTKRRLNIKSYPCEMCGDLYLPAAEQQSISTSSSIQSNRTSKSEEASIASNKSSVSRNGKACTFESHDSCKERTKYSYKLCGKSYKPSLSLDDKEEWSNRRFSGSQEEAEILTNSTTIIHNKKPLSWRCKTCMFENHGNCNTCEICSSECVEEPTIEDSLSVDSDVSETFTTRKFQVKRHQPSSQSTLNDSSVSTVSLTSKLPKSVVKQTASTVNTLGNPSVRNVLSANTLDFKMPRQQRPEIKSSPEDAVIILDNCDDLAENDAWALDVTPKSQTSQDGDDLAENETWDLHLTPKSQMSQELIGAFPELGFSVSKNTGRISVHINIRGEFLSCEVNFAMEQVLTKATSDRLLDNIINRVTSRRADDVREFDVEGIRAITENIFSSELFMKLEHTEQRVTTYDKDIKLFLSNYLKLREIEKKLLKESEQVYRARGLDQEVAKLICSSQSQTERYTDGAKEKAQRNLENGSATPGDMALLDGKACIWCGAPLLASSVAAKASYCSQICAEEGRLRRGGKYASSNIRAAVFAIEGGTCSLCSVNAHDLFKQIEVMEPPERLNKLLDVNWKLPKSAKALENLLQEPKEGNFWQVDHIRAVAEGGGACGLENLRTLCVPCHMAETEKLHSRLLLQSPTKKKDDATVPKRKQKDIRDLFAIRTKKVKQEIDAK